MPVSTPRPAARLAALACLTTCLALPGAAAAEPAPNEAAAPLDELGKKAYREKRFDDAAAAFEAAYEADPLPKFLYNLGRCYEKLGDPDKAVRELGFPQTSARDALAKAVTWFKGRGYGGGGSSRRPDP